MLRGARLGLRQSSIRGLNLSGLSAQSSFLKWPLSQESFHGECPDRFSEQLKNIETHWKTKLESQFQSKKANVKGPKQYVLSMFPYPSGNLHMGHMRVYTISDVSARYYRQNGYNVVHPIGWDSFGLPAENAAREHGVDPKDWTRTNIDIMRDQLCRTGVQFDWEREISTCEPEFYRWTQWIFCRLHERGLLRRNLAEVNWDPVDGTVLAAEQIDAEGRSWRSGAKAEKKKLRQWMVDTPRYAKRLADGLRNVSQWHDVVDIQSNWIGPCDVRRFLFPLRDNSHHQMEELLDLRIKNGLQVADGWFVILRQGHQLSDRAKNNSGETYQLPVQALNGVTAEYMPILVVPEDKQGPDMFLDARFGDETADAQIVSHFQLKRSKRTMPMNMNDIEEIASFGGFGGYETSRTLQDWVVSRQRAWGTPIPMILDENDRQAVPVPDSELPLLQGQGRKKIKSDRFSEGYGYYDSDTLDTFFDSSWYYLRYLDPHNASQLISKEAAKNMPVDLYVGGIEHAAVHMFFARFISYFLSDIGVTTVREPFKHLIPQGIVRGKTYVVPSTGKYIKNSEVTMKGKVAYSPYGTELNMIYEKMSKSKYNGVDPLTVLDRDGISLARLQLLGAAAPRQPINWGDADLRGLKKWLDRVAYIVNSYVEERRRIERGEKIPVDNSMDDALKENYNYFVRNVSMCLEVLHLHNTALARLQGMTNALRKLKPSVLSTSPAAERCINALVSMLQVFVPHASAELWDALNQVSAIHHSRAENVDDHAWPVVDDDCEVDFMINVNGTSCGRKSVPRKEIEDMSKNQLVERARDVEHKTFLKKLEEKHLEFGEILLDSRRGFHVSLNCSLKGEVDSKLISDILNEVDAERRKASPKQLKRSSSTK